MKIVPNVSHVWFPNITVRKNTKNWFILIEIPIYLKNKRNPKQTSLIELRFNFKTNKKGSWTFSFPYRNIWSKEFFTRDYETSNLTIKKMLSKKM